MTGDELAEDGVDSSGDVEVLLPYGTWGAGSSSYGDDVDADVDLDHVHDHAHAHGQEIFGVPAQDGSDEDMDMEEDMLNHEMEMDELEQQEEHGLAGAPFFDVQDFAHGEGGVWDDRRNDNDADDRHLDHYRVQFAHYRYGVFNGRPTHGREATAWAREYET